VTGSQATVSGNQADEVLVDSEHPWPGLVAFREQDSSFFRGRAGKVEDLLRLVRRERVTVLHSRSGLGKSSLLQAGLFPHLREELHLPVYIRLSYTEDASPLRAQVLDAIGRAVAAENARRAEYLPASAPLEAAPINPSETLWEHFHRKDADYWTADNQPIIPVLVFDQFEEAFTRGREAGRVGATAAFLEELGDVIEGRTPRSVETAVESGKADSKDYVFTRHLYKVLIGIRADFLDELEKLEGGIPFSDSKRGIPSLRVNRMPLDPLSGSAALEVTEAGGTELVSADVGAEIVRLVAGEVSTSTRPLGELIVDPALLSLFCRELNERRKAVPQAAITTDLVEGSREGILAKFYADSMRGLPPAVQRFIEDHLITAGNYRDTVALENALATPGVTMAAIDSLVRSRLIRREERDGHVRLELTHDVLTEVVRQSRDRRRAEEEAEERAKKERAAAEARTREERARVEALERAAVAARRRTRIMAGLGVVFLALSAAATLEAITANRNADKAKKATHDAMEATTRAVRAGDSTRRALAEADSQRARAVALADSITSTNQTLNVMNKNLLTAQDSVRFNQRKAIVEAEVADQYLRMSGRLRSWRAAADSAYGATVRRTLDSATTISKQLAGRVTLLASILCDSAQSKPAAGPAAQAAQVRDSIRRQFDSKTGGSICGSDRSGSKVDSR
jgi:conflict system STAND superfamily ATPase